MIDTTTTKEEMGVDITPKDVYDEFVVKYHFENHQTSQPEYESKIILDNDK